MAFSGSKSWRFWHKFLNFETEIDRKDNFFADMTSIVFSALSKREIGDHFDFILLAFVDVTWPQVKKTAGKPQNGR